MLSVPNAARHIGVSRSTFYKLLQEGAFQARKIGQRTLIERAELDRWLSELPVAQFRAGSSAVMRGRR